MLGYHVTGSTGTLFLFGIVIGSLAMLGLSVLLAGAQRTASRGRDARRELKRSQRETAFINRDRDPGFEHQPVGAATGSTVNSEGATTQPRRDDGFPVQSPVVWPTTDRTARRRRTPIGRRIQSIQGVLEFAQPPETPSLRPRSRTRITCPPTRSLKSCEALMSAAGTDQHGDRDRDGDKQNNQSNDDKHVDASDPGARSPVHATLDHLSTMLTYSVNTGCVRMRSWESVCRAVGSSTTG